MSEAVKVAIKVRPPIERDTDPSSSQWLLRGNTIVSLDPDTKREGKDEFRFDYIFDTNATNCTVFDTIVKPIVDSAIHGCNGTVFCYGQSNSGKTYTMIGATEELGIIQLTVQYLFNVISNITGRKFLLRVSYLEIYDEKINDLLSNSGTDLQFYKDDNGQIIVHSNEEVTNSTKNMLIVLQSGMENRKMRETSRTECTNSHNIFRITIESEKVGGSSKNVIQVSQLNLVDLASSERPSQISTTKGQQIDISLSTLETIIMQSKSKNCQEYVNYRNSKLTELLQTSLGGNAFMAIICTVIPAAVEETYRTLLFALQAKDIRSKPEKNEVISDAPLSIRCAKQLIKFQMEVVKARNGNFCIEAKDLDSKLQEKYNINQLLEEYVNLLETQIVSGHVTDHEQSFKCKTRRRQTWSSPAVFKQQIPTFQTKTDLPTIEEMSPEKPRGRNSIQSTDIINHTFQTAFTDSMLDLSDCERNYETNTNGNGIEKTHIIFVDDLFPPQTVSSRLTPEKQDSSVQTSSNLVSSCTPEKMLRTYISHLAKDLDELREFTTLEKQIMCEENHCCVLKVDEQLGKGFDILDSKDNDIYEYSSTLIAQLEEEKTNLIEDLELKGQELSEIKNDVQGLKLDIGKLQKTIYLLTNENMEMSNKLSVEREQSKQAESNLQRTIDELYIRMSKVTDEKINLESDLMILNDQLESIRSKSSEAYNDDRLLLKYQSKIDALKSENIELSAIIGEKNKELESIKESKSLLYDHECMYKDKVALLTQKNECLIAENNELSTDLIDKIEENDMLKEECDVLRNKASLAKNANSVKNDMEQLGSENSLLKAEIMELKMKVTILSDENVQLSNNLLEIMDDLDNSRSEKRNGSTVLVNNSIDNQKTIDNTKKTSAEENCESLESRVKTLQNEVTHLTRLNKKLSDLKLSSCSQCAHLQNLNQSRRALKLEAKVLNHKLEDLQKKFDQKCADTEALKVKVNQELNLSLVDGSLNNSFADTMNVSAVEEKVQQLNNELQTLKSDREKLSISYREKCDELEKLHDEIGGKSTDDVSKPKRQAMKKESRIEKIQNSIDQVRDDIDELKKNSMNFTSILNRFKVEKASLMDEINTLKNINEELQKQVSDNEVSVTTATEKAQILELELLNLNKEIEQYSEKEKTIKSEKLTLEVELEGLKAEKENKDILITGLHKTIDELNECVSSLKNELDLMTSQKNELAVSTETIERKYRDELTSLQKQYEELEKERKQSMEAGNRATLWAQELESDIGKLQADLTKQENLYKELEGKIVQLEDLLQESENEKETLKEKLQTLETQLIGSKDNLAIKYKNEFESVTKKFEEYTKESEMKLIKINETLNQYIEENDSLTHKLTNLRDIELKFIEMKEDNKRINDKKLKEELDTVRESMIKELQSLKCKANSVNILSKTANEIFMIFLQTLMSKEEEVIKTMREIFERDKQKLVDDKKQSADAEKRVTLWSKELETEIEKLQSDLTKREDMYKEQHDKICQLEHLLRENRYEKEILKEKLETLEIDFGNLQAELDRKCNVDVKQEEAIIIVQKREKEIQEAFKNKEMELQSKMNLEKENYKKRIDELHCTVENYKTKNIELKNNIEGLEANEDQLKNIIEANSTELKMNNQTIHRMSVDLEQLTEAYNEVNREVDVKTSRIEEITTLLKSKCDRLSECKAKLESVMPDYEMLKDLVKERKVSIEKYKEEIEEMKMEKEKQIEILKDQLNSEQIKNVGLNKQLNELNNKNITLIEDLDNLKQRYEELQRANAKLEKKIRNSTSKVKAEADLEELKDVNKRLQNNLEGASNRISELQDSRNKVLKEFVNLKGQYELLLQENIEIKKSLASYKSRQSTPYMYQDDGRYDALLQEKNKIALQLEGKKLLLNQRDKEIKEYVSRVKDLSVRNMELDTEISSLKNELHASQTGNKLADRLEETLRVLTEENANLQDQVEKLKLTRADHKQIQDIKLYNDKVFHALRQENSELRAKLDECKDKLLLKSNGNSSKSTDPIFENTKRRRNRSEIFNQRRQIEDACNLNENEETCQMLRKKIQELELGLVSKNSQIATLEIQIQSENFPYQRKCKELEDRLLAAQSRNAELRSDRRKLQRTMDDINAFECDTCRRWRINRREQACQTSLNNNRLNLLSVDDETISERVKLSKLEKEKASIKNACRSHCRRIRELEDKIKEIEDDQSPSALMPIELPQEKFNEHSSLAYIKKKLNLEKNAKP